MDLETFSSEIRSELENWGFPASLVSVVAEHEDYQRDSIDGPDLIDIVQVANLQSQFNPRMIATDVDIAAVPSFRKLGIQTEVEVEELEENSADYAEALAFFGQR